MSFLDVKVKIEYFAKDGSVHSTENAARTRNWKLLERLARKRGLMNFDEWSWRFDYQLRKDVTKVLNWSRFMTSMWKQKTLKKVPVLNQKR
jgi:hypothetical protein